MKPTDASPTPEEFFGEHAFSRQIFEAVRGALEAIGPTEMRVSKSQIAFRRRAVVALVWMPAQYLQRAAAPLVLTFSFHQRDSSPRWKEIVEPHPGRFTHHLELYSPADVDGEVQSWLRAAWEGAG